MDHDRLIASLGAAVDAAPGDPALRLHLARLLLDAGRGPEAVAHAATVLAADPESAEASELMAAALGGGPRPAEAPAPSTSPHDPPTTPPTTQASAPPSSPPASGYDWGAAEQDLGEVVPPMFVEGDAETTDVPAWDVERSRLGLDDVGGMEEVKKRLRASFLAPLHNPELRRLYGKSLRGGLMLYGPPGCGKTFLARAVAGELGAAFMSVSLADVLDMFIGNSEKNVQELFAQARASAPVVLFLDEIDALGQKRSQTRNSGLRTTVNQLLSELDGVGADNEGVFVLAATNHPWDVDPALRRPGRLDRTLLVLPPDRPAREAILRYHLRDRPVERVDLGRLAKRSDGYSGADLAHVCDTAAEQALLDSVATGSTRMITMNDLETALADVRPSIGPWLEAARNVALFANESGDYDELARYLRRHHRL